MVTHNLKVCISTLPLSGKLLNGLLCVEALNKRLNRHDIVFIQAPRIVGNIKNTSIGALLKANITVDYQQQCGVCSVFHHRNTQVPIDIQFRPRPNELFIDDDIDISYYDNDVIDIEPLAEEFLILSLDLWWRCDCSQEKSHPK